MPDASYKCSLCPKIFPTGQGLNMHKMRKHGILQGKPGKAIKPAGSSNLTQKLDAVTICSTVLEAFAHNEPNGFIPTEKLTAWFRWVKATQAFIEEMYGDS